jgi:hypothetical protein
MRTNRILKNAHTVAGLTLLFSASSMVFAQSEGQKLVAEHRCEICHHNKTLGDAKAIYLRKDRKVTSMEKLKAQVARCNNELNLKLFPEDEEHIVAYLNSTYYKFPVK